MTDESFVHYVVCVGCGIQRRVDNAERYQIGCGCGTHVFIVDNVVREQSKLIIEAGRIFVRSDGLLYELRG